MDNQKNEKIAYSITEAASATSLSAGFLRKEIAAGRLKKTKKGERVIILRDDLNDYLKGKKL